MNKLDSTERHCGYPDNVNQITHCGCKLCGEIQSKERQLRAEHEEALEGMRQEYFALRDTLYKERERVAELEAIVSKHDEQERGEA